MGQFWRLIDSLDNNPGSVNTILVYLSFQDN